MAGTDNTTEVELHIGSIKLRVSGSEEFVKGILKDPEEWLKRTLDLFLG
jgi:hypothetical protein